MPVPLSGRTLSVRSDWDHWAGRIDRISGRFEEKGMDGYVVRSLHSLIMDYYTQHGRHDLPWRLTSNPYCIIVSEIMLQQTQVERVIPKYRAFIKTFPDFESLARARPRRILGVWQGLGYNRRALVLKRLAQRILERYNGIVPDGLEELQTLPGIGKATAGAICAFVFNLPVVFIETNIRTVYLHIFFPEAVAVSDQDIFPLIKRSLYRGRGREWYQALMDFGVFLKKYVTNPNRRSSLFKRPSTFQGSDRQIRGAIIRFLTRNDGISIEKLKFEIKCTKKRLYRIIDGLQMDGLIEKQGSSIGITKHF
ncbi:A/G-specific adenine glycosylase [candidate division WOR-3 bacterium]|nr:A/G-specific adenine glycosylase [candidate division WOR-3 bacterium]